MRSRVEASRAKYIKLGEGGAWETLCLRDGTLRLDHRAVPHELGLRGDKEALRQFFLERGCDSSVATSHAKEVLAFYHESEDTLWITFSGGELWWAFARAGVEYLGGDRDTASARGSRLRRTVDGWRNTSLGGAALHINELNGALTATAAYPRTICNVKAFDYLLRKLNDQDLPAVVAGQQAHSHMLDAIKGLMTHLTWQDFELLVDLVFSQSGWRRIGVTGGPQKTVDIELELPSTGERAFVQVKSKTNQTQLDDYLGRLTERSEARMFYVYHTTSGALDSRSDRRCTLIGPGRLADMVLNAGLFTWLLKRIG